MNLRKLAQGRDCTIRLPGCDGGGETTVLAHLRMAGITGVGMKAPDLLGAWSCYHCHMVCDGHLATDLSRDEIKLAFLEGMARTQAALISEGRVAA